MRLHVGKGSVGPGRAAVVRAVAQRVGLTLEEANEAVEAVFDIAADVAWERGRLLVQGCALYEVRTQKARKGTRPNGTPCNIPEMRVLKVRLSPKARRR